MRSTAIAAARPRGAGRCAGRGRTRPVDRRGARRRSLRHPLYVRHDRAIERRGSQRRALDRRRARHGRLRQSHRPRPGAGLPAAGLGRRPLSQLRAGLCRRLLHGLPGKRRHRRDRLARNRADLPFRAAAGVRGAADARANPHGGRGRVQALALSPLHGGRRALGGKDRQRRARALERPGRLRPRRSADLRAAEECAGLLPRARRLHGGRSDRRGSFRLLSLDRPQSEAALRADGSLSVRDRAN